MKSCVLSGVSRNLSLGIFQSAPIWSYVFKPIVIWDFLHCFLGWLHCSWMPRSFVVVVSSLLLSHFLFVPHPSLAVLVEFGHFWVLWIGGSYVNSLTLRFLICEENIFPPRRWRVPRTVAGTWRELKSNSPSRAEHWGGLTRCSSTVLLSAPTPRPAPPQDGDAFHPVHSKDSLVFLVWMHSRCLQESKQFPKFKKKGEVHLGCLGGSEG